MKSVHESSMPFTFDECLRKFALPRTLVKHKKLVHEKVELDICGHVICKSFELKSHRGWNHGIFLTNTTWCDQCLISFHQKASLDDHIAKKNSAYSRLWIIILWRFLSITYEIIYLSLYTYIYATMSTQQCQLDCGVSETLVLKFQSILDWMW